MAETYSTTTSAHDEPTIRLPRTDETNFAAARDQHELAHEMGEPDDMSWLPVVGGGILAGIGLARKEHNGLWLALVGGGLAYWGLSRQSSSLPGFGGRTVVPDGESSIRVEKVVTINRPVADVYDAWRDVERLPTIMSHLESVTRTDDGLTHWVAKAPMGRTVEWDAEIINDDTNRVISWRSVEGADVPNVGAVHFHEAPGGRGTELRVRLEYNPPAGALGAAVARLFHEEPGQQISDDLRRFKAFMEAGEYPTTENQPRGAHSRSLMDPVIHKVSDMADAASSVVSGRDSGP